MKQKINQWTGFRVHLRVGSGMEEWMEECWGGSVKSPEIRGLVMHSQQAEINEELRQQVRLNGSMRD